MKLNLITRKSRVLIGSLLTFFLCTVSLYGDNLTDAALLEKNGDISGARSLYLQWLSEEANRSRSDYGRTLLHVLRLGGERQSLFEVLDSFLPGVKNTQDKMEILKFGAYLSDLSGMEKKAAHYFSLLSSFNESVPSWKMDYYSLLNNSNTDLEDPLAGNSSYHREADFADTAILYLIHLNESAANMDILDWQVRMDIRYPFLRDYPEWLFLNWYFSRGRKMKAQEENFSSLLIERFPAAPETGVVKGNIQLFPSPSYLLTEANPVLSLLNTEPTEMDQPSGTVSSSEKLYYLQAGAFGQEANAEELREEISRKAALNAEVIQSGNVYKVIVRTYEPDRDSEILRAGGFDFFRTLPPDPNH